MMVASLPFTVISQYESQGFSPRVISTVRRLLPISHFFTGLALGVALGVTLGGKVTRPMLAVHNSLKSS